MKTQIRAFLENLLDHPTVEWDFSENLKMVSVSNGFYTCILHEDEFKLIDHDNEEVKIYKDDFTEIIKTLRVIFNKRKDTVNLAFYEFKKSL